MVGAPLDWAKEGSRFKVQGSGFKVQGCGGGFAANIYGAMPESGFLVTSHSYDTSGPLEKGRAEGAG